MLKLRIALEKLIEFFSASILFQAKRKLEEERINALQAIREVEENETQVELDHLKDMVLQLQDNVAFDAEVLFLNWLSRSAKSTLHQP